MRMGTPLATFAMPTHDPETLKARALWSSVVLRAIEDLKAPQACLDYAKQRPDTLRRRARHWLCSTREEIGSFNWICDALGMDADRVRSSLFRRMPL